MLLHLLQAVFGIAVLLGGAYLLLRGAVALALGFGLSRVVVGATVVAIGTSAPEVMVVTVAAFRDTPGVAVGAVIGSNVANVGLVLAAAAVVNPVLVHVRLMRWEIPVLLAATAAVLLLASGGALDRWQGAVLLAGLAAFITLSPRLFPETAAAAEADVEAVVPPSRGPRVDLASEVAMILVGLAGLMLGADQIVTGAAAAASDLGVSNFVIGVTVIAVGTSLPEFATTVLAARRREHEIAAANIIGSNIFNLLGVLGLAAFVSGVEVDRDLYRFELPFLALSSLILVPLAWPRYRITRLDGWLLLTGYALFIILAAVRGS